MKFTEYLAVVKKYEEQKQFECYQLSRELPRPKTTKLHLVIYTGTFFVAIACFSYALCVLFTLTVAKCLIFISVCVFIELYMRFLGVKAVEFYQHYASEERRRKCLCIPSCSEYAIICFKKYPLIMAVFKIRKRLYKTCRGDEYKIDIP